MQLEKITARVRPRTPWEAVDLGFLLLQHNYRTVMSAWVLFTLPVFLIINGILYSHPFWAAFLFWWLLPLFDRIPLYVLSRALFGEIIPLKSVFSQWREWFLPHMLKLLTLYRLDVTRSYNLPVWLLERLSGRERSQRTRVLKKMQSSHAFGLTFMCQLITLILFISLYGLVMLFLPDYYDQHLAAALFRGGSIWWAGPLANLFLYLSYFLVEPFYVAGGFSLYINRRTQLEGWDIEINFRRLAQRASASLHKAAVMLFGIALLQSLFLFHTPVAQAAQTTDKASVVKDATNNAIAKQAIAKIMQDKAFHQTVHTSGWQRKNKPKQQDGKPVDFSLLGEIGNFVAQIAQVLLWVGIVVIILLLVFYLTKWKPAARAKQNRQNQSAPPKSLFGLEITPDSLPEDVGAVALALWREGKRVEALSLLYRGALTALVHRDGINLRGSATEGDCIRIIDRQRETLAIATVDFFKLLTRQWQYAAYAHRHPDDNAMQTLCSDWEQHFGAVK